MKFTKTEPNINFSITRFVSENNIWELGLCPMMFGVRVRAGIVGSRCCEIDYCAGSDHLFQIELLMIIYRILELLPEDITPRELSAILPTYQIKPIHLDPCWENLQLLAKILQENSVIVINDKTIVLNNNTHAASKT